MMDGEHGFLNSGDDTVDDSQGKELAGALGDDEWGVVDTGGKQPGGHIGCTVTGPIDGIMAQGHGLVLGEVGGDPNDNQVRALDKAPQVPIDALRPAVGHGAEPQLLEPLLQIEAVGDHPEVPGAMGEPHKG